MSSCTTPGTSSASPATDAVERQIIGRGLLSGAAAGVFAFLFARIFIEPVIDRAIEYEDGRGHAEAVLGVAHEHSHELFTREVQSWVGMGFGVLGFAVAMAGLFAVGFIVVYNRFPGLSARMTSALLALGAFVAVYLVPSIKYPATPPAIGDPDTIRERSALYLVMVLASVALAVAALWLGRRLAPRLGPWNAALSAVAGYVGAISVLFWVLPAVDETPQPVIDPAGTILYPGFAADDLYHFRLYAVGTQFIIWATIGLLFGAWVSRMLEGRTNESSRRKHLTV